MAGEDRKAHAEAIRKWMKDVMAEKNWSAERWARLAKTTPTNITRFVKGAEHVPSIGTIAKLARVAGSMPPLANVRPPPPGRQVPIIETAALAGGVPRAQWGEITRRRVGAVTTRLEVSEDAFAWSVDCTTMTGNGIFRGDMLIVEPIWIRQPRDGETVLYARDGRVLLAEYRDPLLVHHGSEPLESVPLRDVTMIGVAVGLERRLSP